MARKPTYKELEQRIRVLEEECAKDKQAAEECKRAEKDFREKDKLLIKILNSSPDYIFVKDTELRTILCNEAFAAAVGKKPHEMIGHTDIENGWVPELVKGNPAKGIRGFENDDRDALRGKTVRNPNDPANLGGEIRIFDTYKLPLYDEHDQVIGLLGIARDITERKQAEEALQEAERQLKLVLDAVPAMIWQKDRQGRYVQVNRALCQTTGLSEEGFLGKTDHDLYAAEIADQYVTVDRRIHLSGESEFGLEEEYRKPSGEQRKWTVDKIPYRDAAGQVAGTIGFALDITEEKEAKELLRQSEERFRFLAENMADMVWTTDLESRDGIQGIQGRPCRPCSAKSGKREDGRKCWTAWRWRSS